MATCFETVLSITMINHCKEGNFYGPNGSSLKIIIAPVPLKACVVDYGSHNGVHSQLLNYQTQHI